MLQTLEELSVLSITGIVAAIVLAAVAIYALVQWLRARKRNTERGLADAGTVPVSASPGAVPTGSSTMRCTLMRRYCPGPVPRGKRP